MPPGQDTAVDAESGAKSLLPVALLGPVVGAAAGVVGAVFRLSLDQADRVRDIMIAAAHDHGPAGFLLVLTVCAAATALAAWLVRRYSPYASGSGIPNVEAVLKGALKPAAIWLVPVKFVGGVLAIGSGLALGREGPSVQMSATIANSIGRMFRRDWADCRLLLAAGAGAGLATAFNAPMAGAVFVLEELVRQFEVRMAIVALGASATAIAVSRSILGDLPDFGVGALAYADAEIRPLYLVLGAIAGLVAVGYNRVLLGTIGAADRLSSWPVELRAGLIGAGVGTMAWFAPGLVGGGDTLTQRALAGSWTLAAIPVAFLLRFGLGALSYAARTPGGLFAPLLVLGALLGLSFGIICGFAFPGSHIQPEGFAIVGMAALFTGIVRAPLTGLVLVTEMTASVTMLLPMLGACYVAMLVPTLLHDPPIYDSLSETPGNSTSHE
jgi:chloride channel protein, CIC family